MKYCPTCNFSFPDFHRVCDFDGSELVLDPERQSLVKANPRYSYPRHGLKKPMFLTSLAVLVLFLSAVFIGYLESPAPSIPAIVNTQEVQNSPRSLTPTARTSGQLAEDKLTAAPSCTLRRNRNKSVVSSTARLRRKLAVDNRSRNEVIARTQDSKRASNEKSPKILAVLKTTWKVLKKPFDF